MIYIREVGWEKKYAKKALNNFPILSETSRGENRTQKIGNT